jgi:hypothetical protein
MVYAVFGESPVKVTEKDSPDTIRVFGCTPELVYHMLYFCIISPPVIFGGVKDNEIEVQSSFSTFTTGGSGGQPHFQNHKHYTYIGSGNYSKV